MPRLSFLVCEFQASFLSILSVHKESKHEGIKYPCPHCEYQATQTGRLKVHIDWVHLGARYPCYSCEY